MNATIQTKAAPHASPPSGLLSVEDARARILAGLPSPETETVALHYALGRVSADDVVAKITHPPFPVSSMDGYALRSQDVGAYPVHLRKIGVSRAGERFHGKVEAGTCVRIFTGAILPDGADVIALQEDATEQEGTVTFSDIPKKGTYIRPAGLDFQAGQVCVRRGSRLSPRAIGLTAACGHAQVAVYRRPRIAILSTGDELVPAGTLPGPDQIVGSNGIALAAAVCAWGAEAIDLGIAPDRADAIAAAVGAAQQADLLITTGGASVGDHDLVQQGIAQRGFTRDFWRIAMRPGKPLMFGRMGKTAVLGLPGNPVSALVCAFLFLRPAIRAMLGVTPALPPPETATLGAPLPANDKREDYIRARLTAGPEGRLQATPFSAQDSSMLMMLTGADALIRRAPYAPPSEQGELVEVFRFDLAGGDL